MVRRLIVAALLACSASVLAPGAAHAGGRVSVANAGGDAAIDPTYATTLKVSGSGFQSVAGGHGGLYVFFGTVKPGWQPTKGGITGKDYFYVPDSEARNNQGFQRYVAFPGSDTAGSANGGVMTAAGSWSTELVVPGAVFRAHDRDGAIRTIDCRKVTCGVITVGAHGVDSAPNETFTPVRVRDLTAGAPADGTAAPSAPASGDPVPGLDDADGPGDPGGADPAAGPAAIEVDRESAIAGNVLAFSASGLPPGVQVSAVFDDGAAAAGPFLVGADGRLAGVLTIPSATGAGTHELRLYGIEDPPSVRFAVRAAAETTEQTAPVGTQRTSDSDVRAAWLFTGAAALVLVLALIRLGLGLQRGRRAA